MAKLCDLKNNFFPRHSTQYIHCTAQSENKLTARICSLICETFFSTACAPPFFIRLYTTQDQENDNLRRNGKKFICSAKVKSERQAASTRSKCPSFILPFANQTLRTPTQKHTPRPPARRAPPQTDGQKPTRTRTGCNYVHKRTHRTAFRVSSATLECASRQCTMK